VEGTPLSKIAKEIIWFPVQDTKGKTIYWTARILPTPEKGPKFLRQIGGNAAPFIPKGVYDSRTKPTTPLIITEGPAKALVCVQAGFAAIGLNGVWCAASKRDKGKLVLCPELSEFELRGRKIYICFDADAASNPDVRQASIRLFLLLYAAGAEVYQLTNWPINHGKGIDDYLVSELEKDALRQSPDVLSQVIREATPFLDTITKTGVDTDAVQSELAKVQLPALCRDQLCRDLAKQLDVRVELLRSVGR
jgi:hypothetical protein